MMLPTPPEQEQNNNDCDNSLPLTEENLQSHNDNANSDIDKTSDFDRVDFDEEPQTKPPSPLETETTTSTKSTNKRWASAVKKTRNNSDSLLLKMLTEFWCYKVLRRKNIGTMIVLYSRPKEDTPTLMLGAYWPFCTFITLPLILIPSAIMFVYVMPDAPVCFTIILIVALTATLISLCGVSCSNPGIVEHCDQVAKDKDEKKRNWVWNDRVESFRPPSAIYSPEADVIVMNYDHFCPWTGTAIGAGNYFFFKMFVVTVHVLCYSTLIILALVFLVYREGKV